MEINKLHSVYFIGIGGIGMSALARWFNQQNIPVAGYDKTNTPLTQSLEAEGIQVSYLDNTTEISGKLKQENSLVIYTPAIPTDNNILNFVKDNNYNLVKRSEALGIITKNYHTIAVAGTHGKTSTCSILSHILKANDVNILAFIGGIAKNYNSNVIYNDPKKDTTVVIEADEFDRSFLRLSPNDAIVTSCDPDHLDIYSNPEIFETGFKEFVDLVPSSGISVMHSDVSETVFNSGESKKVRYGSNKDNVYPSQVTTVDGMQMFSYNGTTTIENILLPLPGRHNILNTCAAITIALKHNVSPAGIKQALKTFKGIKRRFEYIFKNDEKTYIDDYAHHPTEISACLKGVRELFPGKTISVVFQPHLYSRTKDFMNGFAKSLAIADQVYLLDIYPARELPIPGITSDILFDQIDIPSKTRCNLDNAIDQIKHDQSDILITMGAGDIDQLVTPIHTLLNEQHG